MSDLGRGAHWENVYRTKGERDVSWFQETPTISLDLIRATGLSTDASIIDVGGGASRLVDALITGGSRAGWIVSDVTAWKPPRRYDLWHDRAAFHFLTDVADRRAYVDCLAQALRPGGHAIIATFALDGPARCSGLPVVRYDGASLSQVLGSSFDLIVTRCHDHATPMGSTQRFLFSLFQRAS